LRDTTFRDSALPAWLWLFANPALKEAGMLYGDENTINLPFVLDVEVLAAE